jgi:NADH-quinone oxidoreductase subunit G
VTADVRERFVAALDQLDLFVLQAQHQSDLAPRAHLALPACSHAETEGTFINADGIAQRFEQAFTGPGDSLPHWQIFARLSTSLNKPLAYTFVQQIQKEMLAAPQQPEDEAALTPRRESLATSMRTPPWLRSFLAS